MTGMREDARQASEPTTAAAVAVADAPVGSSSLTPPTQLDVAGVLALQRGAGNARVAHYLAGRGSAVARQPVSAPPAAVMPAPVTVTWSADSFEVSFSHSDDDTDRFVFTVRYLGPHKTQGPFVTDASQRVSVMIGPKPLTPKVLQSDATGVSVDLYDDGSKVVELRDEPSLDKRPDSLGRRHSLRAMDLQRVVSTASLWVLDPKATEADISPLGAQEFPGDRPSTQLLVSSKELKYSILIDGDGDEDKELELQLSATEMWPDDVFHDLVKTLKVEAIQRSTGEMRHTTYAVERAPVRGSLLPFVQDVTDGHSPTRIDISVPMGKRFLEVAPGTRGAAETRYRISLGAQGVDFIFPVDPKPQRRVASADAPVLAAGALSWDVKLGAYKDRFRVAVRQMSGGKTTFGLSALKGDEPNGTVGLELTLNGPVRGRMIDTGATSIGFDLDGDGKPDIQLFDQLTTPAEYDGGGPPAQSRNHRVRVMGPAVGGERTFDFTYRHGVLLGGFATPGAVDIEAARTAEASGIQSAQEKAGGLGTELDAVELRMLGIRLRAVQRKIVSKDVVDSMSALWRLMVMARPQAPKVEPGLKRQVQDAAQDFDAAYSREFGNIGFSKAAAIGQMKGGISSDAWGLAFSRFRLVTEHFDRLLVTRMEEREGTGTKDVKEATALVAMSAELGEIPGRATRVTGSYHPDAKFRGEEGFVTALPLNLWAWKDGNTWRLKDVTNPAKPFTYSHDDESPTPPLALFSKLSDPDHFPAGLVNFGVPGVFGGRVEVKDSLTWKKFFTYLGIGLAVIGAGLSLATPGGPVAVAGAWALAASALSGAVAAGIDLAEHIQHDNLDTQTAVLDVAQIVAGIAGATALASGRIVASAAQAPAGARWAGAWARAAMAAQKVYLPATLTAAGADVLTVAVVSIDTAKQLDDIEAGPGDPGAKTRTKLLLLSQLAVMGGLTALSLKGTVHGLRKSPKLVLSPGPDGVPVATTAIGKQTLIVDTQVASILEMKARGEKLQPGQEAMLKKFQTLDTSDLRVADRTVTERLAKGAVVPQQGVPISVERTSPAYKEVLAELERFNVGKGGGTSDREIVADALFAITEDGVTPTFATHDADVYKKLYSMKASAEGLTKIEKLPKSVLDLFPDGFSVTVKGRQINVLPLPKK